MNSPSFLLLVVVSSLVVGLAVGILAILTNRRIPFLRPFFDFENTVENLLDRLLGRASSEREVAESRQMIGRTCTVNRSFGSSSPCHGSVFFKGERWAAVSDSKPELLRKGLKCRITGIRGMTLEVEALTDRGPHAA